MIRPATCSPVSSTVIAPTLALAPLERVLAPGVQQPQDEDRHEQQHLKEAVDRKLPEGDRPGIEEDRLDIEHHEQQREDVVADVKLHPGGAFGLYAALISVELDRVGQGWPDLEFAEDERDDQSHT